MAVASDLLEILRCPYCVSGPTRKAGDDPGQLELVNNTWLVCQEPDCERKYPIKEDIPVMLIEEGDKWMNTPTSELPEPGPLVEPSQFSPSPTQFSAMDAGNDSVDRQRLALLLLSILGASVIIAGVFWFMRQGATEDAV